MSYSLYFIQSKEYLCNLFCEAGCFLLQRRFILLRKVLQERTLLFLPPHHLWGPLSVPNVRHCWTSFLANQTLLSSWLISLLSLTVCTSRVILCWCLWPVFCFSFASLRETAWNAPCILALSSAAIHFIFLYPGSIEAGRRIGSFSRYLSETVFRVIFQLYLFLAVEKRLFAELISRHISSWTVAALYQSVGGMKAHYCRRHPTLAPTFHTALTDLPSNPSMACPLAFQNQSCSDSAHRRSRSHCNI